MKAEGRAFQCRDPEVGQDMIQLRGRKTARTSSSTTHGEGAGAEKGDAGELQKRAQILAFGITWGVCVIISASGLR